MKTITVSELKKLKPGNGESHLQKECIRWFRLQHRDKLLFAIPNGGKRDKITASIMKAEGATAGVPDLFLSEPSGPYHGMYIEMKFGRNGLTAEQISFFANAQKRGYRCVVCRSFDEFRTEIEIYFSKTGT